MFTERVSSVTWRDLPADSDQGTLINVNRKRHSILRSADSGKTWQQAYTLTPDALAPGGAQGFADVELGNVKSLESAEKR